MPDGMRRLASCVLREHTFASKSACHRFSRFKDGEPANAGYVPGRRAAPGGGNGKNQGASVLTAQCDSDWSVTVPEDRLFVMGDNRFNSRDSRSFGPISEDLLVGEVFIRLWPFKSFGRP